MASVVNGALAGMIETPAADAVVGRQMVRVEGWALGADGPVGTAFVLVGGRMATPVATGVDRPDVAARHPGIPDAGQAGWEAMVDLRGVEGPTATLSLLTRSGDGAWTELAHTRIKIHPSQADGTKHARAVFTIVQNESVFLPLWLGYYGRYFDPADVYVLDHDSTDGATQQLGDRCNVVPVHRDKSFDHSWLLSTVEEFQSFLLSSYDAVLFSEADEFVVADPTVHRGLDAYIEQLKAPAACCTGYSVIHFPDEEPPLDLDRPVLAQRRYWKPSSYYSKRLLGRMPLSWSVGFHFESNAPGIPPDPHLYLVHLHRVDYELCLARHRSAAGRNWSEYDVHAKRGAHHRVVHPDEFREWFFAHFEGEGQRETIPEHLKQVL